MDPLQSFINNSPEANIKLFAENPLSLIAPIKEKESQLSEINYKSRIALAATVATVAVALILGLTISLKVGVCTAIVAFVPKHFHGQLNVQAEAIKTKISENIVEIRSILWDMEYCVQGRFRLIHFYLSTAPDIESSEKIEEFCLEREKNLFKMAHGLKNIEQLKDCVSHKQRDKLYNIYQLKRCDFSTSITELRENIDKIAKMNFTAPFLTHNWDALTRSCKEYVIPYEQYYQKKKNGKIVYNLRK